MNRAQIKNTHSLNKEKLLFFLALIPCTYGIYLFCASAPVPLPHINPLTTLAGPRALAESAVETVIERRKFGGEIRPSPFMVVKSPAERRNRLTAKKETAFPIEVDIPKQEKPASREFPAITAQSAFDYMGVVIFNGLPYGLLRPRDGSEPRRVKVGDTIANFTITHIEAQTIRLKDAANNRFALKESASPRTYIFRGLSSGSL